MKSDTHLPPPTRATMSRREFLRRSVGIGVSASVTGAVLAACGGQSGSATGPTTPAEPSPTLPAIPTAAQATTPVPAADSGATTTGGTIVFMGHQEVAGLSPDDSGPTVQWVMVTSIHNALLELDENYVIEPVLADSYEVSPDGLTYTFNLRQGVQFHDGVEFTAKDVKYTFEFYGNPENAASIANNFRGIDTIETPDDYTVVIKLQEPNAALLTQAATTFIVPQHYHSKVGQDVYRTAPIGTGAFKLKEWRAAEVTELDAFDDHFRGRPKIDILRQNVVPEPSVRAIALESGEADSSVWPMLVEDNLRFAENPDFTTYRTASVSVNHFPLNNQLPQLSDKRVRQAMMHAIDRQRVIDDVFQGTAVVAHTNISPALEFWHNPNVKQYEYDLDQAAALLDEAGWTMGEDGIREQDGVKLSFTCTVITGDQARRPEAELVQQLLKDAGIDMQIEEAPIASILEGLRKGTLEASLYNWTYGGFNGEPDAAVTLRSDGGNNFSQFQNERVDELLDLGLSEVDPEKRQAIYFEIQEIVAEEVPFLFMMYWDWFNVFSGRVEGLPETVLNGSALYRKAHEWSVEG
ncbi:MAG: ABC transporter substrate-binding protein [Chloroflexales bacterium]|nr:ABC transporter substrate-binding protein [Chloroflexales bacterium]